MGIIESATGSNNTAPPAAMYACKGHSSWTLLHITRESLLAFSHLARGEIADLFLFTCENVPEDTEGRERERERERQRDRVGSSFLEN